VSSAAERSPHFAVALQLLWGFSPTKSSEKAYSALPKAGAKPEGRSDKSIAFAFVVAFAFP
jgi:hypothetical protein